MDSSVYWPFRFKPTQPRADSPAALSGKTDRIKDQHTEEANAAVATPIDGGARPADAPIRHA